jgi:hypothetical protein
VQSFDVWYESNRCQFSHTPLLSYRFDGAGFSITGTQEVLSSIASDCMVEYGEMVNAVEVFWTPSERDEILTRNDVILDFPELIDM